MINYLNQGFIKIIGSFLLLLIGISAQSQQGNNPFDLTNRKAIVEQPATETATEQNPPANEEQEPEIKEIEQPENQQPELESAATNTPDNPFNLKRVDPTKKQNTTATSTPAEEKPVKIEESEVVTPKKTISKSLSNTFKFWMITLLLILLTLSVTLYNSNISKVYRAFLNDNFLKMVHREHGTVVAFPYLLLYTLFFISGGIFVFLIASFYQVQLSQSSTIDVFLYIGLVMGIFLLKHLTLNIISYIFPISKDIKQYSFTIIIFGIVLGLLLIPANVLIAFAPTSMTKSIIYGTFVVIVLLYLFRILRSLFIASRYITLHKFHFFMYLCTVEIAPLMVLIKIILLKTG